MDEMTIDKWSDDEISVDKLSVDEMAVDEMSVDGMTRCFLFIKNDLPPFTKKDFFTFTQILRWT